MCSLAEVSSSRTSHIFSAKSLLVRAKSSCVTVARTSSSLEASPPTAPRTAAASIPRRSTDIGTTTALAFLMRFPLHSTVMRSGRAPSSSLAFAAPYAMAMGSVQPSAVSSSPFRIASNLRQSSMHKFMILPPFLPVQAHCHPQRSGPWSAGQPRRSLPGRRTLPPAWRVSKAPLRTPLFLDAALFMIKIGLFPPFLNDKNSFRCYAPEQVDAFHTILGLREIMPLSQEVPEAQPRRVRPPARQVGALRHGQHRSNTGRISVPFTVTRGSPPG